MLWDSGDEGDESFQELDISRKEMYLGYRMACLGAPLHVVLGVLALRQYCKWRRTLPPRPPRGYDPTPQCDNEEEPKAVELSSVPTTDLT